MPVQPLEPENDGAEQKPPASVPPRLELVSDPGSTAPGLGSKEPESSAEKLELVMPEPQTLPEPPIEALTPLGPPTTAEHAEAAATELAGAATAQDAGAVPAATEDGEELQIPVDESVPPPNISSADYIGTTIDHRYRVEALLGEGGMGYVYRCRHKVIDKLVAIKILRQDAPRGPQVVERFVMEAKAASAIGNAHITDVLDFGTLPDGATYLVMEYLEGQTLTELLEREHALAIESAVSIARQLAEGLGAAHAASIVHRDLKPDNVFLVERLGKGFVKILDFGIAKVGSFQSKITRAGEIFGTPHYMSPEQSKGITVDRRSDIYALGVMLYEMLTGSVPFDADTPFGILTQHITKEPDPPSARRKDLPKPLEAIVLKCLAKDPERRYASMPALSDDLQKFDTGQVPAASFDLVVRSSRTPKGSEAHTLTGLRRPRWPIYVLGLLIAASASGVAWIALQRPQAALQRVVAGSHRASELVSRLAADRAASAARSVHQVALVLSPIDSHAYLDKRDLGAMPVSVNVEPGKIVVVDIRRQGFFSRKVKIDGTKPRLVVRLVPIPGVRLAVPVPEAPTGAEGIEEAPAADQPASGESSGAASDVKATNKPTAPASSAPPAGADKKKPDKPSDSVSEKKAPADKPAPASE